MNALIKSFMPRLMDPDRILTERVAPRASSRPVTSTVPNPDLEFETFALNEITAYISLVTNSPDTAIQDTATLSAETITTNLRALKKKSAAIRDDVWLLYAWCRRCDDAIDGQDHGRPLRRADSPGAAVAAPPAGDDGCARLEQLRRLTRAALASEAP